jgi:hypothetical protein
MSSSQFRMWLFRRTETSSALQAQLPRASLPARTDKLFRRLKKRNGEKAEFLASPVGQATTAKEQGQGFFEIQLQVGSSQRDRTVWGYQRHHRWDISVPQR